jgi:arsenite methyltransferase
MGLSEFAAAQLRKPSGWFGRFFIARLLDRVNAPLNALTLRALELAPDDAVLEIGPGGGGLIALLAPLVPKGRIAAVDFSPEMIARCARRFAPLVQAGRLELRCAAVEDLPYAAPTFTKVCTVNTIYFWPDPVLALAKLRAVLRPGGRIAVTFNPRASAEKLAYTKHFAALYEREDVERLLAQAGFKDVRSLEGKTGLGACYCSVGMI